MQTPLLFFFIALLRFLYCVCLFFVPLTAPAYFQLQKPFNYQNVKLFIALRFLLNFLKTIMLFLQCKSIGLTLAEPSPFSDTSATSDVVTWMSNFNVNLRSNLLTNQHTSIIRKPNFSYLYLFFFHSWSSISASFSVGLNDSLIGVAKFF